MSTDSSVSEPSLLSLSAYACLASSLSASTSFSSVYIVTCTLSMMDGQNIGSILIFNAEKKLVGIFTERDIMHCFAKNVQIKQKTMKDVMTPNPVTLDAATDISVAVTLMSDRKIRHLPVMEDEKIIGMVSYRDLVAYLLPEVIFMAEDIY